MEKLSASGQGFVFIKGSGYIFSGDTVVERQKSN